MIYGTILYEIVLSTIRFMFKIIVMIIYFEKEKIDSKYKFKYSIISITN